MVRDRSCVSGRLPKKDAGDPMKNAGQLNEDACHGSAERFRGPARAARLRS
jgi:hypothetical protein